jgi:hypothetical protein
MVNERALSLFVCVCGDRQVEPATVASLLSAESSAFTLVSRIALLVHHLLPVHFVRFAALNIREISLKLPLSRPRFSFIRFAWLTLASLAHFGSLHYHCLLDSFAFPLLKVGMFDRDDPSERGTGFTEDSRKQTDDHIHPGLGLNQPRRLRGTPFGGFLGSKLIVKLFFLLHSLPLSLTRKTV